jgi:dihydrofolate reductase
MRKIVGAVFQSLDGVMQAPGGAREDPTGGFTEGGWQMGFRDEVADAAVGRLIEPPYALLLGRRTYDIFAAYWPFETGEEAALGEAFTKADKYVLTRRDTPLEWENSHRLANLDELAELKKGDGPELRIWGSSTLYPPLLKAGLLDQLVTLTYPLTLGSGKRTFGEGTPHGAFRLVDHQVGPSGAVIAVLEPAGAIPDRPDNLPQPNAREEQRQAAMADGTW